MGVSNGQDVEQIEGDQVPIAGVGAGEKPPISQESKNPSISQPSEKTSSVTSVGQSGGITANTVNINVQEQARVIQTIEGNIELVFSGNWRNHPGDITPVSWNKAEVYARIFVSDERENGAILFSLESMRMARLPDDKLKVNIEIRAKAGSGALGGDLKVLRKYDYLSIYVPFIFPDSTIDTKLTLKELSVSLFVNGEEKSHFTESASFEIPILEGKAVGVIFSREHLFAGL